MQVELKMLDIPDDVKIDEQTFVDVCILKVGAGTNAPEVGYAGCEGRTVLQLTNTSAFQWDVVVHPEGETASVIEQPHMISLTLGGYCEARHLVKALRYAADNLERQMKANGR